MPIISKVICDGCGAEKKSENHWWVLSPGFRVFAIQALDKQAKVSDSELVLCGEPCVHKKISEWMGAQKR